MQITLTPELETALKDAANRRATTPEKLAQNILHERLLGSISPLQPRDEWERRLLGLAKNCGVSLSDAALSSEGLYE